MIDWIIQNALWTALFAGLLTSASDRRVFSPALRHALWLVVLIKFVTPPIPMWAWPGVGERLAPVSERISAEVSGGDLAVRRVDQPLPPGEHFGPVNLIDRSTGEVTSAYLSVRDPNVFVSLLPAAWLTGTLVYLAIQAIGFIRFRRKVHFGKSAPAWLEDEVDVLADRLGVSVPDVRVVPGIRSPLICGTWRMRLLWPEHMLGRSVRLERRLHILQPRVAAINGFVTKTQNLNVVGKT